MRGLTYCEDYLPVGNALPNRISNNPSSQEGWQKVPVELVASLLWRATDLSLELEQTPFDYALANYDAEAAIDATYYSTSGSAVKTRAAAYALIRRLVFINGWSVPSWITDMYFDFWEKRFITEMPNFEKNKLSQEEKEAMDNAANAYYDEYWSIIEGDPPAYVHDADDSELAYERWRIYETGVYYDNLDALYEVTFGRALIDYRLALFDFNNYGTVGDAEWADANAAYTEEVTTATEVRDKAFADADAAYDAIQVPANTTLQSEKDAADAARIAANIGGADSDVTWGIYYARIAAAQAAYDGIVTPANEERVSAKEAATEVYQDVIREPTDEEYRAKGEAIAELKASLEPYEFIRSSQWQSIIPKEEWEANIINHLICGRRVSYNMGLEHYITDPTKAINGRLGYETFSYENKADYTLSAFHVAKSEDGERYYMRISNYSYPSKLTINVGNLEPVNFIFSPKYGTDNKMDMTMTVHNWLTYGGIYDKTTGAKV